MLADNRQLFIKLSIIAAMMFGFGFALVPLYKQICEATGVNDLLKADAAPVNTQVNAARLVTIEFDANLRNDLPWRFKPKQVSMKVHPGQLVQVEYELENLSDRVIVGQAIPSYGPAQAGPHFRKLECFCFKQQAIQPREKRSMPVVFLLDRALPDELNTVTLSYTFFEVEGGKRS
ncbi:cytochrome c oxidase assembly protein subunit 11 [Chitinivorax tropicus]|uniref:Cytochrome c oxidase assembly protein CtaG n=1 Tax=Chitinivorax tropicus TaxID=714531 RepID=A0A840MSJ9_9PROT|nr:cytochrome c oxidase assembly protein subunit 11 [Chitinivorax tropicus]